MIKRGDIYYYSKDSVGSEMAGGRPGVIVSHDAFNLASGCVTVVPLTTQEKKPLPTHCVVKATGRTSTALAEQIETVSVSRLSGYAGHVSTYEMGQIETCITVHLCIRWPESIDPEELGDDALRGAYDIGRMRGEADAYRHALQIVAARIGGDVV